MIICSNRSTEPCDRFSKFAPCVLLVRDCHSFSDSAIKAPILTCRVVRVINPYLSRHALDVP